jgi:hypothetical protein
VITIMGKSQKKPRSQEPPTAHHVTPRQNPFVKPTKKMTSSTSLERSGVGAPSSCSSSDSETEEIGSNKFADFVPTSLPLGKGIVSMELQVSFRETLDVMAKLDFSSLSPVH